MPDDLLAGLRTLTSPSRDLEVVKRFGLHDRPLTPRRWEAINEATQRWKQNVLHGAREMPHQAYRQGHQQTTRFLRLLGTRAPVTTSAPDRAASEWLQWLLEHELTGTLDRYADDIRSAVLYGLQAGDGPAGVAASLYKATQDADRDWRLVARTEMARANSLGRLDGCLQMGYDEVWVPPHAGACSDCKALVENKVFLASVLKMNSNYGKKRADWVPCLPLHPRCSHTALPYVEELYREAQEQYAHMRDTGLDDETLDEMFDTSGQLRPQYRHDERLEAFFAGKTVRDPFEHMLGEVVGKVRSTGNVGKGFFDPPQVGLDPLVWEDSHLKPDVRTAILNFWTGVLGDNWRNWAKVYITGSATSYQWGTGWAHPWLGSHHIPTYPDVDTHLVIDYAQVREDRPLWAGMSPMELRKLLESWVKRAKEDIEVAPGLRLDAYVRLETTADEFERDIRGTGQGVYNVGDNAWMIGPTQPASGEYVKHGHMLAGTGGRLAHEHPDWVQRAEEAGQELQDHLAAYQADPAPTTLASLQVLMDALYDDRTVGFLDGNGQEDRGNFTWAYLSNFGPLQEIKELLSAS